MSTIEPMARATLTTSLVQAVGRLIAERRLGPGERLGTQRELAERFDVSVPTLREALRRLEALGALTLRHGSGIYVGENVNRSVLPNLFAPVPDRSRLAEYTEARALIEPAIAEQAAAVRAPEGLAKLHDLLAQAAQLIERGDPGVWRVNLDLHRAIASTAGNGIVEEVLDVILLLHAEDQRRILELHGQPETDHAEHAEIVRLITDGAAAEARDRMRRHLTDVTAVIRGAEEPH